MFLLAVRRGQIVATSLVMAITEGREPLAKLRLNIAKLRQLLGVITVARVIYWIPKVENYIYWDEWESFAPGLWLKWCFQKLDRRIFSSVCCCGKNFLSITKSPKLDYSRFNKSLQKRERVGIFVDVWLKTVKQLFLCLTQTTNNDKMSENQKGLYQEICDNLRMML